MQYVAKSLTIHQINCAVAVLYNPCGRQLTCSGQNVVVLKFMTLATTYVAAVLFIGRRKESVVGPKFMMSSIIAVVIVALGKSRGYAELLVIL